MLQLHPTSLVGELSIGPSVHIFSFSIVFHFLWGPRQKEEGIGGQAGRKYHPRGLGVVVCVYSSHLSKLNMGDWLNKAFFA